MQADPLILALGDSLTAGYGLAPTDAFPAQLERRLGAGARVVNAGVSGDTSAGGLARLPGALARCGARPDLAIVELGANDLLRWIDPATMRANLDAILAELGRRAVPALLAGMLAPPMLGERADRFNAVFPELAARRGAALYPFFLDGVALQPGMVLADGYHPNARAIGEVADRILPHVRAALEQRAAA